MNEGQRKELIEFIIAKDVHYDYKWVNFKYYSDNDLLAIKDRLIQGTRGKIIPGSLDPSAASPSPDNEPSL